MSLKGIIIFTSGVAAGGLAATLFWRERYRQKYKKEADEKISSMLDYVNRLREDEKEGGVKARAKYAANSDVSENVTTEDTRNNPRVRVNYSDIYSEKNKAEEKLAESEYPRDEDGETGDERNDKKLKMKDSGKDKPKIISYEDYETQYTWFDKATLIYYTEDGVLAAEEDNEPIDDIERYVGDALDKYNFRDSSEREIYVRNFSRGTDYVIVKYYSAWADS